MYKVAYLYPRTHEKLIQLKNAGHINSIMSFIDTAVNEAIAELPASSDSTKEIVITIKIEGGKSSEERN